MLKDVVLDASESDAEAFSVSFWKVEVGEDVAQGDELVVLESTEEKTALAVRSPYGGRLHEIVAGEDTSVGQGDVLCRVEVG
jgi:pyruvate/2-oxoglutarate dehydrogenase complex dihydrolipoamide acyltransferase (E2) component